VKYATEITSGGMIYIPSSSKIGTSIQKFGGEEGGCTHTETHTHRQQGDSINRLLFFQNKEGRLKMTVLDAIFSVPQVWSSAKSVTLVRVSSMK
jgi:hypothetical protein